MTTRRNFLLKSGILITSGCLAPTLDFANENFQTAVNKTVTKFKFGVASYSLRNFKFDEALEMVLRLGLNRMALKSMHLPLESNDNQILEAVKRAKDKDIDIYGAGTIYMKTEQEVDQAFNYAKTAGFKIIIGAPNYELLPYCEKKTKETEVILAIHNHGPGDALYPSPMDAYDRIKNLDRRIGLCMDIGHTQRWGQDPSDIAKKVFDRLYDVHIKDVSSATKEGFTLEIGRGVIDIPKFLKTMMKLKYSGTLNLEYEKDEKDPLPGMAESVGYLKGVLAAI